ncbi:hypothetical protein AAKU55_000342 [Oxalobacteraceae bacterium GrIS 1.11]
MDLIEIEKIVSPAFDMEFRRGHLSAPAEIRELQDIFERMHAEYDAAPNKRIVPQALDQTCIGIGIGIMLSTMCRIGDI